MQRQGTKRLGTQLVDEVGRRVQQDSWPPRTPDDPPTRSGAAAPRPEHPTPRQPPARHRTERRRPRLGSHIRLAMLPAAPLGLRDQGLGGPGDRRAGHQIVPDLPDPEVARLSRTLRSGANRYWPTSPPAASPTAEPKRSTCPPKRPDGSPTASATSTTTGSGTLLVADESRPYRQRPNHAQRRRARLRDWIVAGTTPLLPEFGGRAAAVIAMSPRMPSRRGCPREFRRHGGATRVAGCGPSRSDGTPCRHSGSCIGNATGGARIAMHCRL